MKDEFFIGYAEHNSKPSRRGIKPFLFVAVLFLIIGGVIFSLAQNPFADSTFELTKSTHLAGTYYENPYPMIRVKDSTGKSKSILLLGFGKFGANKYFDEIKEEHPRFGTGVGSSIEISGNLIYYNDQTLIQLTSKNSILVPDKDFPEVPETVDLGIKVVTGEIVDPKCYFGVMKPGYGKIHRSCAARCISGGIPGVLVSNDSKGKETYYIITDEDGQPLHEGLIDYIGQPAEMKGFVTQKGNWNYIKINPKDISVLNLPSDIFE